MPFNFRQPSTAKEIAIGISKGMPTTSGIYIWKRTGTCTESPETPVTSFYIGKASNLAHRTGNHILSHNANKFDLSLKTHKDWTVEVLLECPKNELDMWENKLLQDYLKAHPDWICKNSQNGGLDHGFIGGANFSLKQKNILKNKKLGALIKSVELNDCAYRKGTKELKVETVKQLSKYGLENSVKIK